MGKKSAQHTKPKFDGFILPLSKTHTHSTRCGRTQDGLVGLGVGPPFSRYKLLKVGSTERNE